MVSPYSAGTFTLQEAPSFAWRTNGLPITRAAAGATAPKRRRVHRLVSPSHRVLSERPIISGATPWHRKTIGNIGVVFKGRMVDGTAIMPEAPASASGTAAV